MFHFNTESDGHHFFVDLASTAVGIASSMVVSRMVASFPLVSRLPKIVIFAGVLGLDVVVSSGVAQIMVPWIGDTVDSWNTLADAIDLYNETKKAEKENKVSQMNDSIVYEN